MENETRAMFGTCSYCGQSVITEAEDAGAANDRVTALCMCPEGERQRRIKAQIDEGYERVKMLFGEYADAYGFEPICMS